MHAHAKPARLDDAIAAAASDISDALSGELHLFHARVPWATASHQVRGPRWVPDGRGAGPSRIRTYHGVESTYLIRGATRRSLHPFSHESASNKQETCHECWRDLRTRRMSEELSDVAGSIRKEVRMEEALRP